MTQSQRYPLLFSPLRVGPVVVPNRIVFAAHLTNYAEDGLPSARHAAYYAARARGGAGLVITEEHSTHPTDWPYEKMIHGYLEGVVERYRTLTAAVHRYGTPVFAQINHNGGQSSGMYTRLPVWAPSPVADPLFREVPHAVTEDEIGQIVAGYSLVARHCAEGGFDGVELQCSHSSIVRAFLSPSTNLRTDRWGGDIEGRTRLLRELLEAVRSAVGPDLALGVRLCGDELVEGGTTIADAVAVARLIEEQGCADYINTSIGVATATLYMIEASMHVPPDYCRYVSSAIREAVSLPVVGVGRVKDPLQAERALSHGHCDLVGVVRGQIADADFARKARAGESGSIRLCLSCNQECVGRMGLNRSLGCIENPLVGREHSPVARHRSAQAAARPPVVVVGAGPAGLQAAIAAAERGLPVVVFEAEEEAGGAVAVAARAPRRAELGDLVRNQSHECRRLGVRFEYRRRVGAGDLAAMEAHAIVIATGARPRRPSWPEEETVTVLDVREVLGAGTFPGGRVLVFDELGFHEATSVAEVLAERGAVVEIVTPAMVVGQDLSLTLDLEGFMARAAERDIVCTTDRLVTGLVPGGARLLDHRTGREERREVDAVVTALHPVAADELFFETKKQARCRVFRVGDCVAPRRAHAAILEGERVGSSL